MPPASSPHQLGKDSAPGDGQVHAASVKKHLLCLVLATLFAYSMLFFVSQIWSPGKNMHLSDLYPRWYGARELLLHGRDPYSAEVTREIQLWRYGYVLDAQGRHSQLHDEARFAYPLYIVFILWPLIWFPAPQTYHILQIALPAISLATAALWIRATAWKPGPIVLICAAILAVFNFPVLEDIYLQQPVVLAAFFMAASLAALATEHLYAAGALLALATIKPQVSIILVIWLLFWAGCRWQARKGLIIGVCAALSLLVGASECLTPRWPLEFVAALAAYQRYTGMVSMLAFLFGETASRIITLCLLLAFAWLAWQTRAAVVRSSNFNFTLSAALVVTIVTAPTLYPTGQIVLIPVILLLVKESAQLWAEGRWVRLFFVALLIVAGWPWFASTGMLALRTVLPLETLRSFWMVVLAPVALVPFSLLGLLVARVRPVLRTSGLEQALVVEQP
jgi:hypothetical protein